MPPPPTKPSLRLPSLESTQTPPAQKKAKKGKQPKKWTPTATAIVLQIKGKKTKIGERTGLGIRPVKNKLPKMKSEILKVMK